MDANRTDKGTTKGTTPGILYNKNLKIVSKSSPLPASSAMNSHTACKIKIKNKIVNTVKNVLTNVFKRYLSNIFTKN